MEVEVSVTYEVSHRPSRAAAAAMPSLGMPSPRPLAFERRRRRVALPLQWHFG